MSAHNPATFAPEQLTVTSGVDPGVTINLIDFAWIVPDLVKLSVPAVVIDNRPAPGVGGTTPLPPASDEVRATLTMHITGQVKADGTPTDTTLQAQFRRHWVYLSQHLFIPSGADALDAVYTPVDPDEDDIACRIQFATPSLGDLWPTDWVGTLNVVLPDGPLIPAAAGS